MILGRNKPTPYRFARLQWCLLFFFFFAFHLHLFVDGDFAVRAEEHLRDVAESASFLEGDAVVAEGEKDLARTRWTSSGAAREAAARESSAARAVASSFACAECEWQYLEPWRACGSDVRGKWNSCSEMWNQ